MGFLFALLLASLQTPPTDTTHLVIVATTDVHGRVLGWDYVRDAAAPGGLSRAATILETLRAQYPGRLVLVDAGDLLQGNPFATFFGRHDQNDQRQSQPIVDALNALQYDVATPGNHDFDFGLGLLRRAGVEATYRYVAANVDLTSGGSLFPATVVLQRAGVRVGVTGFTTPGVMVWDRAQLAGQARVRRVAEAAPAALAQLEREGANVKVVLIHAGLGGGSSYDTTGIGPENDAAALAAVTPKPDVVIVGHSHREIRDTVINRVHFVQPKNWALSLSVVHVWVVQGKVVSVRADLVPLTTTPELPRFSRRMEAPHQAARLWAATPIGTAGPGFDARYARVQDGALLDFINDVQRRKAGAQLSAAAAFDVQAGLPDGEVHLRDVAGVYPYENTLRAVRVSGRQLREFLEHSARYFRTHEPASGVRRSIINDSVPGFNFDVVSGVAYNIDLARPAGQRIRGLAYEGRLVQPTDSFTLALNSYRAAGGGGYTMLAGARVVYDRGEDVRDLLVDEIRRAQALGARAYFRPSWAIIPPEAREAARAVFAPAAPRVSTADSTLLRVLALADLHGQLESRVWDWSGGRAVGGAAVLKPWLDSLAKACRCTSVRLDAGDEMQGTPVSNLGYGRGVVAAMNVLGIDAAAIGNHEFDWSIDTLLARMQDAQYRFVSANITDSAGTARPHWALPWTLVTKGGVKVAVIGLTTRSTPTGTWPRNVRGLAFGDGAQAIRRYLGAARQAADFVIVTAHEGGGDIFDVARQLDSGSVDLIVAGHTHRLVDTTVNGIPIVQAGSSGRAIAVVDFVRVAGRRREVRAQLVTPYADAVKPDVDLAGALGRQLEAIRSVTSRSVGRLKVPLRREGAEYGLGRLIADALRNIGKADVAIMNNGGIRAGLPEGNVTWGDMQTVQPFQNRILRLTVKGSVLLQALEHCVGGDNDDPDCHVSGVEVWYDPRHGVGKRVTRTRLTTGKEIDGGSTYTLAVPDFLAAGGSGFAMLVGAPAQDLNIQDMDLLISYLGVLRTPVEAPADVRFHRAGR